MSSQFKRLSKALAKSLKLTVEALEKSFRPATIDDLSAVSNMRRREFLAEIKDNDEEYLEWRYFRHAGYSSTLWVFDYQNAVVGAMGTEPVELLICGKGESAIRSMDVIVNPDVGIRGLGAWMTLALQERNSCILVCGGNDSSMSMLKKLFQTLAVRQTYKLMLASSGSLKKKKIAPIAEIIAPAVNIFLACHRRLKWLIISPPKDVEIRSIEHIDELIAHLPDTPGLLGSVKVHRSGRYLAWRYRDNPRASFMIVGAFRQGQLLAYVIYNLNTNSGTENINFGRIVDWDMFSNDACVEILSSLYVEVVKHFIAFGAEQIIITLNDKTSSSAAKKAGFILREAGSDLFVYKKDAKPDDPIFSPELWYQSISDSDTKGF